MLQQSDCTDSPFQSPNANSSGSGALSRPALYESITQSHDVISHDTTYDIIDDVIPAQKPRDGV